MHAYQLAVVTAGLSQPSSTRMLGDRLAEATRLALAAERPAEVRVIELRELAVDIAKNLVTGFPSSALADALDAVTRADALIAVTPIFTASYSGLFKSFFDVLDNTALTGKPVLIAATGGSARHSLALEHALRPLFSYLHATVIPTAVYAASEDWASTGASALSTRITRAAHELAALLLHRPSLTAVPTGTDEPANSTEDTKNFEDAKNFKDAKNFEVVPFAEQLAAIRPA
ncbi:oxidoreductase [Acrocarpospora pleiomorpha]|uniref:Oxidoreductase n=1 Tax=Acrocarpospora pleiomorpha TaxID=90975 RepID=A0A5M3XNE6_9ACTN|nr:FMN reductase [Acrocarpospora pleiomorpha]GES22897.1 oxidoreductase [Acrocarpospora pleiomorpha]